MATELPGPDQTTSADRRGRLLGIKLRALVRDHLSDDTVVEPDTFAPGAALIHHGEAWVLLDDRPEARLGAALAWSLRGGAGALHVITESGSGVLARRATEFSMPITVWHADGRALWPAVPEPYGLVPEVPAEHARFRSLIVAGGADPVEEFGVLAGEVRGLEVCRVIDDPFTGSARLEIGIGAHDREAFTMIHGDVPTEESLARVVAIVEEHRRIDAAPHPFNRLARERLLRSLITDDPSPIGAATMEPLAPPVPRRNLKDAVPCVATGRDADGRMVVAVCSVGVDLDVIPYAADARLAAEASVPDVGRTPSRLVVVTPSRDRINVTRELAGLLRRPSEFVSI